MAPIAEDDAVTKRTVAVLGGGVRGLTLAFYAARQGHDVVLIEQNAALGGVCQSVPIGRTSTPIFYHALMPNDRHFFTLLDDLGIADCLRRAKTTMGFFHEDQTYPLNTIRDFLLFKPISFVNRIRLGLGMLHAKSVRDWRRYEHRTAFEYIRSISGAENARVIWGPLLKAKFGHAYDSVNAADLINRINRMTDDTSNIKCDYIHYVAGTLKFFIEACEKELQRLGVKILRQCSITRLEAATTPGAGVRIEIAGADDLIVDRCVSTIPLNEFSRLLDESRHAPYISRLHEIRYLDNACLILNLNRPLTNCYQLNISDPEIPFTGIIGLSNLYGPSEFGGTHMFYLTTYFHEGTSGEIFKLDEREALERYRRHLVRIQPDFNDSWIIGMKHIRRKNIEVFHALNYSELIPKAETPIPGLLLCTGAQVYPEMTVLNSAVRHARDTLLRIEGDASGASVR